MIAINKFEKEVIAEQLPDTHIVRMMKQHSKRHHYYCEETQQVMELLEKLRNCTDNRKVGAEHGNRKKKQ